MKLIRLIIESRRSRLNAYRVWVMFWGMAGLGFAAFGFPTPAISCWLASFAGMLCLAFDPWPSARRRKR